MNPAGISEVYSLLLTFDSSESISGSSWTTGRNPWGISVENTWENDHRKKKLVRFLKKSTENFCSYFKGILLEGKLLQEARDYLESIK